VHSQRAPIDFYGVVATYSAGKKGYHRCSTKPDLSTVQLLFKDSEGRKMPRTSRTEDLVHRPLSRT